VSERKSNRREFLVATSALLGCGGIEESENEAPGFLSAHHTVHIGQPRRACLEWFGKGHVGMSFQYGVYSKLASDPWVRFHEAIPGARYDKLKEDFTAKAFDAEALVRFAQESGATYMRFPARLYDGFSLFRTNETPFTSLSTPANRDLVGEMTDACRKASMGLFLEYAYGLDWRHPYFYSQDSVELDWPYAAPPGDDGSERKFQQDEDFFEYIRYSHVQLKEILYRYVPLAGIALSPVMGYYARPHLFPLETTYEIIHEAQPQVLLSFEQGANGEEDFVSLRGDGGADPRGRDVAERAWSMNRDKPGEKITRWSGGQAAAPKVGRNVVREIQLGSDGALPVAPA
jgi:alpha-L-fucosidase